MRTFRRPLAFAATCATALLGVGLVAGASPAAAATPSDPAVAVSDCIASYSGSNGLDANGFQACLDQALTEAEPETTLVAPAPAEEAVEEEPVYEAPAFYALDVVFQADVAPVEEAAPADTGLGGAFAALRDCESGGDYGINTGNGYYGAYQFSLSTWQSLGYGGYPHEASPATQDQAASELQALYGWGQWPGCSWYLGLG
ncbi:MAG: resuscitation-promoting factor RpfB [Actinomycetota bacterium]|nr:resuscitation-promoting factor RpfB [Actinomycetota bacterium]